MGLAIGRGEARLNPMRSLRSALIYAAVWIPVALGLSFALLVSDRVPALHALGAGIFSTLPAALLGIPVIALCGRLPWPARNVPLFAMQHVLLAIGYSGLWAAAIVAEITLFAPNGTAGAFMREGVAWQFIIGLLVYAAIAGVTYLQSAVRKQEEQARLAARAEALRLQAELNALRARLDPHFLFNVLQTLGALMTERPQQAHTALELLAGLLKRRLDAAKPDEDDATLVEELEDVREYVALERLRLGSRLEVAEQIEPSTNDLIVPRFTLQPLVENAIRHGIAPRAGPGRLALTARRNGTSWTLEVADDGAGSSAEQLTAKAGIGLSVVRERLRLRFGTTADVGITTSPGEGCAVTLRLPVVTERETETEPRVIP
jgi:two-component system, LytTR family, sensor kinase